MRQPMTRSQVSGLVVLWSVIVLINFILMVFLTWTVIFPLILAILELAFMVAALRRLRNP